MNRVLRKMIELLPTEYVIAMYDTGRFLTRDFCEASDIDVFCFVIDRMPERVEYDIYNYFKEHPHITKGRRCALRLFYVSDFEKNKRKSPISRNKTETGLYIKLMRKVKYRLIYGKEIDFNKFPIKDISPKEELKLDLGFLQGNIDNFKKNNYQDSKPYANIPNTVKMLMHVCKMEHVLKGGEYEHWFYRSRKNFPSDHIFHKAYEIRMKNKQLDLNERKELIKEIERYIKQIK